jgi:hypoxanthine-DNA glycosylase
MRIASFPPVVNADAEILILGTMPGAMSLAKYEYYAHRQNAFWKIMYTVFADGNIPEVFPEKVALLQRNNIALWDVLAHCERKGSLDSNIKNQEENDILGLLSDYPKIKKILFNGKESHRFFLKKFGPISAINLEVMPSTSPAYTMKFEEKLAIWRVALER